MNELNVKNIQENFRRVYIELLFLLLLTKEDMYGFQLSSELKKLSNEIFDLNAFCGAQRIPMHFRADAMHNITDALKYLSFRINSWAGSLQYSALWPSLGSH